MSQVTLEDVARRYAVAITPAMEALIDPTDPDDPIARQFRPDVRELNETPGEMLDPIGDEPHSPLPGIAFRYRDRVLFKVTAVCPVYCRFCFRRESVGPGKARGLSAAEIDAAITYIEGHPEIWEVIFTGGDPLALSPRRIAELTARIAMIPHVAVLRWHTRVPIVDPARISDDMIAALRAPGKAVWIAVRANHAREFSAEGRAPLARLADAGFALVSQTVLLRGVNDDAATLEALMRAFVANRVKPYYLHHPDMARGTGHFRLSIEEGPRIVRELKIRASGLAQPTYVLDIPGGHGKAPLTPEHVREGAVLDDAGVWRDYSG
jgi:lysine 2,3-aminomutase